MWRKGTDLKASGSNVEMMQTCGSIFELEFEQSNPKYLLALLVLAFNQ